MYVSFYLIALSIIGIKLVCSDQTLFIVYLQIKKQKYTKKQILRNI